MKKNKAYYEKQFVEELLKVGVSQYSAMDERNNTYYCFWLKDGTQRYWTNMSEKNLNNIVKSIKG